MNKENYLEVLDQLNKLTAQVKDIISGEVIEEDGFVERIIVGDKGIVTLHAGGGYNDNVDILCEITNTGNGFIARFPSYTSVEQENYICMDYSEAEYLRKLLGYIHSKQL